MQKVKVHVLCDFCYRDGEKEVDATETPVQLDGGKVTPVGMCDDHRAKHYDALAEVVAAINGTKPRAAKKAAPVAPAKKSAPAKKAAAKKAAPGRKQQTLKCAHCEQKFSTEKRKPGDPDGSYDLKRPAMALSLHIKDAHPEAVSVNTEAQNDTPAPEGASKKAEPVPA